MPLNLVAEVEWVSLPLGYKKLILVIGSSVPAHLEMGAAKQSLPMRDLVESPQQLFEGQRFCERGFRSQRFGGSQIAFRTMSPRHGDNPQARVQPQ